MIPIIGRTSQFVAAVLGSTKTSTLIRSVIAWGALNQITTVTLGGTYTAGQTAILAFTPLNGSAVDVEYVVQTGDTGTEVATGFAAAFNDTIGVSGFVIASSSTTTLTVRGKGTKSFTITSDGSEDAGGTITVNSPNTQEATATANIEVGRAVIRDPNAAAQNNVPCGKKPVTTDFTALSHTYTITSASSAIFWVDIEINGVQTTIGPVAHSSDTATTIDNIDTAVDAAMDGLADAGYNVVATNTDTTLILTADVPGASFKSAVRCSGSASADVVGPAINGASNVYELRRALLGFATLDGSTNADFNGGDGVHLGGSAVPTAYGDEVCLIAPGSAPANGSGLWVLLTAGTTAGTVYTSGGTGRVWLGNTLWTDSGFANVDPLHLG